MLNQEDNINQKLNQQPKLEDNSNNISVDQKNIDKVKINENNEQIVEQQEEIQTHSTVVKLEHLESTVKYNKIKSNIKKVFGEIFRFTMVFSLLFIFVVVFVNFNIFYIHIKDMLTSPENYGADLNIKGQETVSLNKLEQSNIGINNTDTKETENIEIKKISESKKQEYMNAIDDVLGTNKAKSISENNERSLESYLQGKIKKYTFNFNLLPPGNRVMIPEYNIDAPVVDVPYINPERLANADFDEELYKGVVRYPYTGTPGSKGNSLLFGHTSYYWWKKNPYGEIFARLPRLKDGTKIKVIWDGKLHEYELEDKIITWPSKVAGEYEKYKDMGEYLTLMGCYPIGTDSRRILAVAKKITNDDKTIAMNDNKNMKN